MLLADELITSAWLLIGDILDQIIQSTVEGLTYPVKLVKTDPLRDIIVPADLTGRKARYNLLAQRPLAADPTNKTVNCDLSSQCKL